MNKDFKVGQRVWSKEYKEFATVVDDSYFETCRIKFTDGEVHSIFNIDLHQTADDMFEELGYEDKSHTTKGWFLIEKDFGSYIEEIRIDLLTGDYKKSRIFSEDKMMWSGTFTKEEHLAIHQKLIELGRIE